MFAAAFLEFTDFIIFTHIRLYDSDRGHVLFYALIQRIIFRENRTEVAVRTSHDEEQDDAEYDHCRKINAGDPGAQHEAHDHGDHHGHRAADTHAEEHHVGILDIRHISRESRHKAGRGKLIDI